MIDVEWLEIIGFGDITLNAKNNGAAAAATSAATAVFCANASTMPLLHESDPLRITKDLMNVIYGLRHASYHFLAFSSRWATKLHNTLNSMLYSKVLMNLIHFANLIA